MKRISLEVDVDLVIEPSKLDDLLESLCNEIEFSCEQFQEVILSDAAVVSVTDVV